jgi:hypothetical protein
MLLIAQPKSASTSLALTLAKMCKLKCRLGIPKRKGKDVDSKGFKSIQRLHNNMVKRTALFIKQIVVGRRTLFKEHIIPDAEHLKILSKHKEPIVILLRNPGKALEAYKRVGVKVTEGLKKDLVNFHNKYMWWASNKKNVLVIYFEDLILNYHALMKRICRHYKLKYKKIIPMMKKKYTGIGAKEVREQREYEKEHPFARPGIVFSEEQKKEINEFTDKEDNNVTDSTT